MKEQLPSLGRLIHSHTEDSPSTEATLREARSRLQTSMYELAVARPSLLSWKVGVPTLMAAAALFTVVLFTWRTQAPLSVAVEAQGREVVGHWIGAEEETKQLRFSDGTSLSLHPRTRVQVRKTTSHGANIVLGQGRTLAQIEPSNGADWRFFAGPFTVKVTGTEFDLAWDPGQGVLELALHQGAVELSGPTVDGTRKVRKGEFVRVALSPKGSPTTEETTIGMSPPVDPASQSMQDGAPEEDGGSATGTGDRAPHGTAGNEDWRSLLKNDQPAALREVDRLGSKRVLESATSGELWSLARAGRVHGRPAFARDALLALRSRHGQQGQTSYLLGKIHADQLHAPSEAIRWFDTYLNEAPNGALAEQALGRLVELQKGTRAGARAAKRYLNLYPEGAYAEFARSALR